MSGYDKHPDYGGAPVTRWTYVSAAAIALAVIGALVWLMLA